MDSSVPVAIRARFGAPDAGESVIPSAVLSVLASAVELSASVLLATKEVEMVLSASAVATPSEDALSLTAGVSSVGLATMGLETVGLATCGLETVGLETVGLETVGLATVGLATVGLATVGLATVGLATVGLGVACAIPSGAARVKTNAMVAESCIFFFIIAPYQVSPTHRHGQPAKTASTQAAAYGVYVSQQCLLCQSPSFTRRQSLYHHS
jgi:hypothetical protein